MLRASASMLIPKQGTGTMRTLSRESGTGIALLKEWRPCSQSLLAQRKNLRMTRKLLWIAAVDVRFVVISVGPAAVAMPRRSSLCYPYPIRPTAIKNTRSFLHFFRRQDRQRLEREIRKKDMALRRAYFDRLLLEEGESAESKERRRVEAVWDEAEQHAWRKGGDFSVAWQRVPSVSEKHIFGFHERHGGKRVRDLSINSGPSIPNPFAAVQCPRVANGLIRTALTVAYRVCSERCSRFWATRKEKKPTTKKD